MNDTDKGSAHSPAPTSLAAFLDAWYLPLWLLVISLAADAWQLNSYRSNVGAVAFLSAIAQMTLIGMWLAAGNASLWLRIVTSLLAVLALLFWKTMLQAGWSEPLGWAIVAGGVGSAPLAYWFARIVYGTEETNPHGAVRVRFRMWDLAILLVVVGCVAGFGRFVLQNDWVAWRPSPVVSLNRTLTFAACILTPVVLTPIVWSAVATRGYVLLAILTLGYVAVLWAFGAYYSSPMLGPVLLLTWLSFMACRPLVRRPWLGGAPSTPFVAWLDELVGFPQEEAIHGGANGQKDDDRTN